MNTSYGFHKQLEWNRESTETYLYEALSFDILICYRDTEYEVNRRSRSFFPSFSNRFKPMAEYITANGRHLSRTELDQTGWGRLRCKDKDYYLQDILGSVVGMTDEWGNQKDAYSFDVWGNRYDRPHRNNGNSHNGVGWNALSATVFGFNGKKFDPKVGLYDYGFRDYKPEVARWTTVDPIKDGVNWYAYVGNDPVNLVDPFGLMPEVGGTGQVDDPLKRAIIDNLDFDEPGSKCDEFCTDVMDDAGLTPDDWPDPDDYKVGENPEDIPNYIDHYSGQTKDIPNTGANAVMMETGHPAEHMGIVDVEEDGPISGAHYSGGEVEQFEYDNQNDFEDTFVYEDFHYLPLE
ncbi:RHS repeat-associated core domain-containing protein [Marispirochaeta sp.]|uniref:RHS repeat-associated core domain-containing protein n=1 Tax=Marispirochaeta sp. TaxID=2038653 RepID=UPI0029C75302|nr:RHS repeat-associated core domain-containing protein [Marispirochaeta sp.]